MSDFNRRQFLKDVLARLAQGAGSVVVATAAVAAVRAGQPAAEPGTAPTDLQERADRLAASEAFRTETTEVAFNEFLNAGFRNTPLGAFRNSPIGGFRNTPLGAFRNGPVGGFRNTPLSTFANGGWPNSPWGGFRNGGWPNHAWGNWW